MTSDVTISDLRHRPEFFDTVADRIWQAWWKRHGVPEAYIVERLRDNMQDTGLPIALVAHRGADFLGTASLLVSDLDERPHYTPWIAAVWIEPAFRSRGLGRRLVDHAVDYGFSLGIPRVYLTARPARRSYYEELGWTPIEHGVGDLQMTVFARDRP